MSYQNIVGATQMELLMYAALEDVLKLIIGGSFYPRDTRPATSKSEDAVITVTAADAEQVQEGRARLNIFVPDKDNGSGAKVIDNGRVSQLEGVAQTIIDALNVADNGYSYWLVEAPHAGAVPQREEHYVNYIIDFKRRVINY